MPSNVTWTDAFIIVVSTMAMTIYFNSLLACFGTFVVLFFLAAITPPIFKGRFLDK